MTPYDGEYVLPVLTLPDGTFDGTTAATVTVHDPLGGTTSVTATASDGGQTHTADSPVQLTMPGIWLYAWTVTGTGAGTRFEQVQVAPAPTADTPAGVLVYATTADYAWWLDAAPPVGAARSLRVASERVDELLRGALYETDSQGYPSDAEVRDTVRWATCEQADYQRAIGDPYGRGALGTLTSMSIGSVTVARGKTASGSAAPPRYAESAARRLKRAGLLTTAPWQGW